MHHWGKVCLSNYMKISKEAMGHPEKTTIPEYEPSASDIKYLVCAGPTKALTQKYLIQSGVPAADFNCEKSSPS